MSTEDMRARIFLTDTRTMPELADESVALVVTSPPYYTIKDYDVPGQIGHGQSLYTYLRDLYRVWRECHRVLMPGARLCVNIGDQFARAKRFGRYKVIPLHAEVIAQAEQLGFDYMGAVIWQKRTTMETSGGAVIMGSYPHPPNGVVEIDYEFILLFKKRGKRRIPREQREAAAMTKEEWKTFFSGHWSFGGARQGEHGAVFPEELPRRLIRMYTVHDDLVLDPFLGSGTTAKVALTLGRRAVGYELNPDFRALIETNLADVENLTPEDVAFTMPERPASLPPLDDYTPAITDIRPRHKVRRREVTLYRVTDVVGPRTLRLADGREIRLLGIIIPQERTAAASDYLSTYVLGKRVSLRTPLKKRPEAAYVRLKNRLFVNRKMIEMGLAAPDTTGDHPLKTRFQEVVRGER
jgi:DNA modification methylase